jgi:hypothetical protein
MKTILRWLFGCRHERYTFPQTAGVTTYVCCLDCGKEFFYSWDEMERRGPVTSWSSTRREWLQDAEEVLKRHEIAQLERMYRIQ